VSESVCDSCEQECHSDAPVRGDNPKAHACRGLISASNNKNMFKACWLGIGPRCFGCSVLAVTRSSAASELASLLAVAFREFCLCVLGAGAGVKGPPGAGGHITARSYLVVVGSGASLKRRRTSCPFQKVSPSSSSSSSSCICAQDVPGPPLIPTYGHYSTRYFSFNCVRNTV